MQTPLETAPWARRLRVHTSQQGGLPRAAPEASVGLPLPELQPVSSAKMNPLLRPGSTLFSGHVLGGHLTWAQPPTDWLAMVTGCPGPRAGPGKSTVVFLRAAATVIRRLCPGGTDSVALSPRSAGLRGRRGGASGLRPPCPLRPLAIGPRSGRWLSSTEGWRSGDSPVDSQCRVHTSCPPALPPAAGQRRRPMLSRDGYCGASAPQQRMGQVRTPEGPSAPCQQACCPGSS